MTKTRLVIPISIFLIAVVILYVLASNASSQNALPVVAIDPGHGRIRGTVIDSGAVNGDLFENDVNFEVAQLMHDWLGLCPVNVSLTREGDDYEHTLKDTDELINVQNPAVDIVIHTNSSENANVSGTEAWCTVDRYNDTGNMRLAELLAEDIASEFGG